MNPDDVGTDLDKLLIDFSRMEYKINANAIYGAMGASAVGIGVQEFEALMIISVSCKKLIKEKNIRIPHDVKFDDILLSSKVEPDFVDNLKEEYPEYFI